jgi:hypothetical protein
MLTRRFAILATAATVLAARAEAADVSAHDFVAAIYATYVGKNGNGVRLDKEQTVRRYFEASLAALILKDQETAARRNEVGALDFDPFVDAQDWDIAAFDISISEAGTGKATATVKFKNFDKPSTIMLDLVKAKNDWRIGNITWMPHEAPNNLRALYTQ